MSGGPSCPKEDVAVRDLAVVVVAALATVMKDMRAKAVVEWASVFREVVVLAPA